jgi:hypothetical protein
LEIKTECLIVSASQKRAEDKETNFLCRCNIYLFIRNTIKENGFAVAAALCVFLFFLFEDNQVTSIFPHAPHLQLSPDRRSLAALPPIYTPHIYVYWISSGWRYEIPVCKAPEMTRPVKHQRYWDPLLLLLSLLKY